MKLFGKTVKLSSAKIIIGGFAIMIFIGAGLLMLPFATRDGQGASFGDALFTATSASCVTGLIVQDTATYWSVFGKAVILTLIQIGGMGVVTMAVLITMRTGRKISLSQRAALQDSISAHQLGGIVRSVRSIVITTLCIEGLGAVLMCPVFINEFGVGRGILYAVWHSVSAFCNAGFDLMGVTGKYSSLTSFTGNADINIVIMLLIIIGGIGFLTWDDIKLHGLNFKKYRLQSKLSLVTSAVLIAIGFVYFMFFEYTRRGWGELSSGERIWAALFQSVTTRTAGFNTTDLARLSESGQFVTIMLMLVGGSSGSTAGGMKTTTIAVLVINAVAVFRRRDDITAYDRRISEDTVRTAATILTMYVLLFVVSAIVISTYEGLPLITCMFETSSAIATVGLTLGVTPTLHTLSRLILIFLMFFGRVGILTIIYATVRNSDNLYRVPEEKVTVG